MTTSTVRIPAHMNTDQYQALEDACYIWNEEDKEEVFSQRLADSLNAMMYLSLWIEQGSVACEKYDDSDVSLDIELWDNEFVCVSGDIVFREAKGKGAYVFGIMCPLWKSVGIISPTQKASVFQILRAQRRLEQAQRNWATA